MRQLLVALVALASCATQPVEPDAGEVDCINPGGFAYRCVEPLGGDCEGNPYLDMRDLAPEEGLWRFDPQSCGEHTGSWVSSRQLRSEVVVERVTYVKETYREESWTVTLSSEGRRCTERFWVWYADDPTECDGED